MEELERRVVRLVAMDRISKPISSISGKLKRRMPSFARDIDLSGYGGEFTGERVYARVEEEDKMKARGMREGIEVFSEKYPRHGEILKGIIAEKRVQREVHLYFGLREGRRVPAIDYQAVLCDMGFTEATARRLYPELVEISRNLVRKKNLEQGRILIG